MAKNKLNTEAPAAKADEVKKKTSAAPKKSAAPKGQYSGKDLTIKVGQAEYTGLCIGERKVSGGRQVLVNLGGRGKRYFNAADIV